ncbi:hypothetical protein AAG906_038787 [Vitis piasezkii]
MQQTYGDLVGVIFLNPNEEKLDPLHLSHILSFCQDLFVASTDTSAGRMQWAIAKLINYPDAFKVREEIDLVVGGTRLVEK